MQMNELKKYVSLNLLSLIGYICFFVTLYMLLIAHPQANQLDKLYNDWNGLKHTYDDVLIPYFYYSVIHIFVSLLLMIGAFVEFLLIKKGIIGYVPYWQQDTKIKSLLFWIGILFVPIPVYLVVILYGYILATGI